MEEGVVSDKCADCTSVCWDVVDGKRQAKPCLLQKKLKALVKDLEPYAVPEWVPHQLKDVDPTQNLYMVNAPRDQKALNGVLAYLRCRPGMAAKSFKVLNIYELIEIFLQHHNDFNSVLGITQDVLVLLDGYFEMENKRLAEICLQAMDNRRRHAKVTWVVSLNSAIKYPTIQQYLRGHAVTEVNLTPRAAGGRQRI